MSDKRPWTRIKCEYIAGEDSIRALAEKYGVPESSLEKRAAREKWGELRRETSRITAEKLTQAVSDEKIKKIEGLTDLLLDESMRAAKQLKRRPVVIREREVNEAEKTETVRIHTVYETGRDIDRDGLNKLSQTAKNLYGIVAALRGASEGGGTLIVRFPDDADEDINV